jgi:menaquinone-dependent protoporphyrinogen oxidase
MNESDQIAKVLVAYGSKHGATAEIAERIGAVLGASGLTVEVLPAHDAKYLDRYGAIVLGSAVYALRWRREARIVLRRLRSPRPGQRIWLFSSGPLDDEPHDSHKLVPKSVLKAAERPGFEDHRLFAGRYPRDPSNFIERSMMRKAGERRDFRDWPEIEGWAQGIARELVGTGAPESHADAA